MTPNTAIALEADGKGAVEILRAEGEPPKQD